jgi:hypothetical protein
VPVPRLELENIEAVVTRRVLSGGRVSGLSEYEGRDVLVIVPAERPKRV